MTKCDLSPYSGATWDWHVSRSGIGDACRNAAIVRTIRRGGQQNLVLCDGKYDFGVAVLRNFVFVDAVVRCGSAKQHGLQQIVTIVDAHNASNKLCLGGASTQECVVNYWSWYSYRTSLLQLSKTDLRCNECKLQVPCKYVVMQPSSYDHVKRRIVIPQRIVTCLHTAAMPVVVIGGRKDAQRHRLNANVLDLRGKTTIPEAMWLVANSVGVLGTQSWAVLLATMCGLPSLCYCSDAFVQNQQVALRHSWPNMRCITQAMSCDSVQMAVDLFVSAVTRTDI